MRNPNHPKKGSSIKVEPIRQKAAIDLVVQQPSYLEALNKLFIETEVAVWQDYLLQPPCFDAEWSDAAQLGGIGFIIAHEIGHGFDDQGSRFDANGNLRNWCTEAVKEKFIAIANKAVAQADAYEILPGHFLNGKLELGEILGDLNGLHIAHRANVRIAKAKALDLEKANQEFFEHATKVWHSKLRKPVLLKLLDTDGHPPGKYRVNGIFPHLDTFHALYQTPPGDGMYLAPEDRLRFW